MKAEQSTKRTLSGVRNKGLRYEEANFYAGCNVLEVFRTKENASSQRNRKENSFISQAS
jgi:hypothetical protein